MRDYIHVVDLADGHIAALNKLSDPSIGTDIIIYVSTSPFAYMLMEWMCTWAGGIRETAPVRFHAEDWNMIIASTAGCEVYNLGTGKGTSVLEMVDAFEKASGKVWTAYYFPAVPNFNDDPNSSFEIPVLFS